MKTGAPAGEIRVPSSTGFNDIEVADDGTIYATQTGVGGPNPDPTTWQVWKITPRRHRRRSSSRARRSVSRTASPSTPQGNIVVINIGNNEVLTFSPAGQLLTTENAVQPGNDGLVVMPDGTKYVSSVQQRRRVAHPSGPARRSSSRRTSRTPRRCATTPARTSW